MGEAVQTMASPAATWAIVVIATCLALFMATVTMFMDLSVARTQRRERMLGIGPVLDEGTQWPRMTEATTWPRLSEVLLAKAGAGQPAAVAAGTPTGEPAARHDIPAQRQAPGQQPAPARQPTAAQHGVAAEAEAPTEPIPAASMQGTQDTRGMQDAAAGRHERADEGSAGEMGEMPTRPDLMAQEAPGRHAVPMPAQRTGESDRAERSFAGPGPQDGDDDEGEQ
jgi:hypothetical protein